MGTAKRSAEGQAEGQAGKRARVSFLELCADEEMALGMFRSAEAKATITRKVAAEQGVGDWRRRLATGGGGVQPGGVEHSVCVAV